MHPEGGKPLKTREHAEAMRVFVLSVADAVIAVDKLKRYVNSMCSVTGLDRFQARQARLPGLSNKELAKGSLSIVNSLIDTPPYKKKHDVGSRIVYALTMPGTKTKGVDGQLTDPFLLRVDFAQARLPSR